MKSVDELNKKTESILNAREKDLTESRTELTKAQDKLDAAEAEVIAKTKTGSTKEYLEAKEIYEKQKAIVEMCQYRVDELENRALITEQDYLDNIKAVKDECDMRVSKDTEEVVALLKKLWDIYTAEAEELDNASHAMADFQHKVYRDEDRKNPVTRAVNPNRVQEYKNYNLVAILRWCFTYDQVRELIGVGDNI